MKKGWEYKKLGEVATYINGFPFKPSDWGTDGLPIIRIQNLTGTQQLFNKCSRNDIPEKYIVRNGDVLISWSATLGVFEWKLDDAFLNQHIFKVVFDKVEINKRYFEYAILISINIMSQQTNGATMKHIRKGDFDNIEIPVPPLSEQQRIVDYLDSAFAKIDAMKANAEKSLNEAKAFFQASLKEMLEPKEGWEEKKLKEIAQIKIGPFGSLLHKKDYISGGVPLVNPIHMVNGHIAIDNNYTISESKAKELSSYLLKENDIVFARRGEIGRCALVGEKENTYLCGTGSLFVRFNQEVDYGFMLLLFQSKYCKEYLEKQATGATMLNINSAIVGDMPIKYPHTNIQQSIVATLDSLKSKVDRLQANYDKISQECDALKQAILRQVFE